MKKYIGRVALGHSAAALCEKKFGNCNLQDLLVLEHGHSTLADGSSPLSFFYGSIGFELGWGVNAGKITLSEGDARVVGWCGNCCLEQGFLPHKSSLRTKRKTHTLRKPLRCNRDERPRTSSRPAYDLKVHCCGLVFIRGRFPLLTLISLVVFWTLVSFFADQTLSILFFFATTATSSSPHCKFLKNCYINHVFPERTLL